MTGNTKQAFMAIAIATGFAVCTTAYSAPKPAAPKKDTKGSAAQKEQQQDIMNRFNGVLKHRFAPVIKNITFGPAVAGKPVQVTVTTGYETPKPIDKVVSVSVYYSFDNGASFIGPMPLKGAGNTFKGAFPAIKKKGKVLVYAVAKDSYGNVGVNVPCKVGSTWPPITDGCMVTAAADKDPSDDPAALIENDFDIWEVRIGMDDKSVFIDTSVEGKINKGTMNPTHINAYLSMIADSKILPQFSDISQMQSPEGQKKAVENSDALIIGLYAPLAKGISPDMKACSIPRINKKAAEEALKKEQAAKASGKTPAAPTAEDKKAQQNVVKLDDKNIKCKADGSDLFMKIEKSVMRPSMANSFTLVGGITGFIDNTQTPMPTIRDFASFTNVVYKPYSFTVK